MGEVVSSSKKEKADLIFVYNDSHMKELKKIKEVYDVLTPEEKSQEKEDECGFEFTNNVIKNVEVADIHDKEKTETSSELLQIDDTFISFEDI